MPVFIALSMFIWLTLEGAFERDPIVSGYEIVDLSPTKPALTGRIYALMISPLPRF
jgi:hypothetical protein